MVRLDENNDNDNSLAVVEEPTPSVAITNATESEINRELEAEFRARSQVTDLLDEYDEEEEENKNAESEEEEEDDDEEDDGENTNNEDEEDEDDDENDSNENDDEDEEEDEDESGDGNEQMESREEDFDYGYERDSNNQNTNQSDNNNDNGDKQQKSIDSNTDCLISEQGKNKISDNDEEDDSKSKEDRDKLKLSPASRKIKSKMLNKYKYKYKNAHQTGDEAKSLIKQEKTINAIKSIARASTATTTATTSSQPAKKIVSAKRVILPVVPLPQTSKLTKKPPTKSSDEALISNPIRAKSSIKKKLYSDKLNYFGETKHDEEESGEEEAASKKSSTAVKFASEPSELSASSSGSLVTVTAPASTSNLNDPLINAKLKLGKGKNTPDFVRMKTGGGTTSGSQFINSSDSSLSQHFTKLSKTFDDADAKFNKSTSSMMILDDDNQEYTYDEQDSEDKNSSNNSNSISYSNLPIGSIDADDLGNNLGLNRRRRRDQNSLFNRFSLSSTFSTASNYNSFYSSSKPVNLANQLDEEDKSDDPDKKLSHNDTHNDDLDDLHGKSVSFMSMTSAIDTTHNKNNETIPFINQSQLSISSHHHIHPINKSLSSSIALPNNNVNINQRSHLLNQTSPSSQDQFMDSVEEDL